MDCGQQFASFWKTVTLEKHFLTIRVKITSTGNPSSILSALLFLLYIYFLMGQKFCQFFTCVSLASQTVFIDNIILAGMTEYQSHLNINCRLPAIWSPFIQSLSRRRPGQEHNNGTKKPGKSTKDTVSWGPSLPNICVPAVILSIILTKK